jgi:hypothetical protein
MDDIESEESVLMCPHCGEKIVFSKGDVEEDKLEEARTAVREKMQKYMSEDEQ